MSSVHYSSFLLLCGTFLLSCIFPFTSSSSSSSSFIRYHDLQGLPYTVTYDNRSFLLNNNNNINNTRTIFLSGSVHYPRSTPGMWDDIFNKAVNDGLNLIETYYFLNAHQHKPNDWNFTFNTDLKLFLDKAAAANLFINFRIGIYICGEWNYGGFPIWINSIPNLTTRTSNPNWLALMNASYTRIVNEVRNYFPDQGGNIILTQIENEYGDFACDGAIGSCDMNYVNYCGELANSLDVGLVEMCNGYSANNTINSCNGNDCTNFLNEHGQSGQILLSQPALWTENEAWFQQWGEAYSYNGTIFPYPNNPASRTPMNIAYTIGRWFARGGTLHNYYMWYGGFHMARNAGTSVSNGYAQMANLNSDGLSNQPYRQHLANLHHLLSTDLIYLPLLECSAQAYNSTLLQVFNASNNQWVPGTNTTLGFGYTCYAPYNLLFMENSASVSHHVRWPNTATDQINGYLLPSYTIIFVDGNTGNVLFNTSNVPPPPTVRQFTPYVSSPVLQWEQWSDGIIAESMNYSVHSTLIPTEKNGQYHVPFSTPSTIGNVYVNTFPYEQLNITEDDTEYMVYTRMITTNEIDHIWKTLLHRSRNNTEEALASTASIPLFIISQISQAFMVFVDGVYSTTAYNNTHNFVTDPTTKRFTGTCNFTFSLDLSHIFQRYVTILSSSDQGMIGNSLPNVNFTLSIVSESIGIDNGHGGWVVNGTSLTQKGIFSTITINGVSIFYGSDWTMISGLQGEDLQVYTAYGGNQVTWSSVPAVSIANNNQEENCTVSCEALVWYRTFFTTPSSLTQKLITPAPVLNRTRTVAATSPASVPTILPEVTTTLMLDIGSIPGTIGRGHFYLNGVDLGRYWSIEGYETNTPGQEYYILPPDLLIPDVENGNLLVLVDVLSGSDITGVQLVISELVNSN